MDAITNSEIVGVGGGATVGWVIWYVSKVRKQLVARIETLEQRNEEQDRARADQRETIGAMVTQTHNRVNAVVEDVGRLKGSNDLVVPIVLDVIKGGK